MIDPVTPPRAPVGRLILALALLQVSVHWVLVGRGVDFILSALTIDDTYYYLQTAWNLKRHGFATFDGIHPTNGVQFLWFWVLAGLAWFVPGKIAFLQLSLALSAAANAACHWPIWRLARSLGIPSLAVWISTLWLLQSLGSVAYSRGLENSIHALIFWCLVWQAVELLDAVDRGGRPRLLLLTALLVLNAWARIDAGIFSALIFLYCLLRAIQTGAIQWGRHRDRALVLGASALALAGFSVQCAVFHWMGGSFLPVSALVKAGGEIGPLRDGSLVAALMRFGLPHALPPGVAWVFLGSYLWLGRHAESRLRSWREFWWLLLVGVVVHLIVVRGGQYWYLTPSNVFWSITLGLAAHGFLARLVMQRWARLARAAPWLFVVVALGVTGVQVQERWQREPNFYNLRANVARWASVKLPPDTVFASWNAGQLGYFSEQPVINLDGLANSAQYYEQVLRGGRPLKDYLVENGVDFIIDRSEVLEAGDSRRPLLEHFERVREFGPMREGGSRMLIWRVAPADSPPPTPNS